MKQTLFSFFLLVFASVVFGQTPVIEDITLPPIEKVADFPDIEHFDLVGENDTHY
jgi:hypothetical protein